MSQQKKLHLEINCLCICSSAEWSQPCLARTMWMHVRSNQLHFRDRAHMKYPHSAWVGCHWIFNFIQQGFKFPKQKYIREALCCRLTLISLTNIAGGWVKYIPHATNFNSDFSHSNSCGHFESPRIDDFYGPSIQFGRLNLWKQESVVIWCIIWNDHILVDIFRRRSSWENARPILASEILAGKENYILHGNMYNSRDGIWSKAEISVWKFFAMTSVVKY